MNTFNYKAINDAWDKSHIAVIDGMPGSGKTTAVTQYLKDEDLDYVIFVSPFKSEVEKELPSIKLSGLYYTYPKPGKGGKVADLAEIIKMGDDSSGNRLHRITCTHSAFTRLNPESIDLLGQYTVIIDETLDVIQQVEGIRKYTDHLLMNSGTVDNNKLFKFNNTSWFPRTKKNEVELFSMFGDGEKDEMFHICQMAATNQLYRYDDSNWFRMLPIEFLSKAKRVLIMTHGFENSFMHCWLKINKISHSYVDKPMLGLTSDSTLKSKLKNNITLIKPPLTFETMLKESDISETLSMSHWKSLYNSGNLDSVSKSLNSLIKEKFGCKGDNLFWTCPKTYRRAIEENAPRLKGKIKLTTPIDYADPDISNISEFDEEKGLTHSSWLPCNIKARNDFGHLSNCLYAFSVNPNTSFLNLLSKLSDTKQTAIRETFKLNNLLQFIFRGSIRNNEAMKLCVIPHKTQKLLENFLE